jgi:hypothetical protein
VLRLEGLEQLPVVRIPVGDLILSDSPRRSGENLDHVRALAESEDHLPPIIVHQPTMRVVDGMHRLRAARMRGETEIEARFFQGDEASSYVLAVRSNVAHGLPLSLADRKAAAARIIGLYPIWSDRAIASITGLAAKTVAALRKNIGQSGCPSAEDHHLDARLGRDGRVRPRNRAERRELAAKLIRENPHASLREIAKKAEISPETVRSVRAALGRADNSRLSKDSNSTEKRAASPDGLVAVNRTRDTSYKEITAALQALRADPSLRSTESGRVLLQLLSAAQALREHGHVLITGMPAHCMDRVSKIARECARAWYDFAEKTDRQSM